METTGRRRTQLRLADPNSRPIPVNKLMKLPEMRVTEPCLRALESESDRTGKSVYEIAREVMEEWLRERRGELESVPAKLVEKPGA
jgi:hypothetical protein